MAETVVPITNISNTSINQLVALVNAIAGIISGDAVTANGSANGGLTVGNSYVSGIFGASVLVGGSLRGGNVQSSDTLPVSSNVFVTGGTVSVGNSAQNSVIGQNVVSSKYGSFSNATVGYFNQSTIPFANASVTNIELLNAPAGSFVVDSYSLSILRTAEYVIQAVDNAANNYQALRVFATHDGVNPYFTEYALLQSNNQVASFAITTNSTSLIVTATTASTNSSIRMVRTALNS